MDRKISLWQRLRIGTAFALVASLGVNVAIAYAMVHSPDSALMMARHGGATPSMVADLGTLQTVQVCARRLPA